MAGLVIKDLPDELHRKLKAQAARHHRSMTKEAVALLERGLQMEDVVQEPPAPYRGKFQLDEKFLDAAKREGRK